MTGKRDLQVRILRAMFPMVLNWHVRRTIVGPSQAWLQFVTDWREGLRK